ncbi:squalene monooxygenase erg1 [Cordyceps fumosorosea ARSEF 2679]|uniref:Squalene monooxygenase n=1 Tax=Cordyceps fumosorosea (strain ARSEF 2679) TaxID=1081104 RepID=A0A167VU21_CORFA|nr:squalene monooxygenase erg1 [Cordyceps fumosorosea ARSEF 2679]OAA62980.1 squalene monooxygenase erg1 [Cordyceps fumosorosea ARSEF 2679]
MTIPIQESFDSGRAQYRQADVIVVGAGIFGSAAAVALSRQGRSVLLLERSLTPPDRIVGELLPPGGVQALQELGLGHCLDGIDSVPVQGHHVRHRDEVVTVAYPESTEGRSFHRGRFVQRLRRAASEEPGVTLVETLVTGLITVDHADQVLGVTSLTDGEPDCFFAPLTIIANSKLRTAAASSSSSSSSSSKKIVQSRSRFWALELPDTALPSPGFGHVLLGDAPVLLCQIGAREASALVQVPKGLEEVDGGAAGYVRRRIVPGLPACVRPAFLAGLEAGRLRCLQNSLLPAASNRTPGLLVAGDAPRMRHSLTGGGVTAALNDVVLLGELLDPSRTPDFDNVGLLLQQFAEFHWRRRCRSFGINVLTQTLYSLFAAEDDYYLTLLRQGCLEYLKRGGICVDGPAGITKNPFDLLWHFFAVVLFSIWGLFLSKPTWKLPVTLVDSVGILLRACLVLVMCIFYELAG